MTSIETSLPLPVLVLGAVASIVLFVFLLRGETRELSRLSRWTLIVLRSALCLVVWLLIAQPRAVTTRKEILPVTANLGIDVSQSMSLADEWGANTDGWRKRAEPDALNEAITLAEAARIRINLLTRRFKTEPDARKAEIVGISGILSQVRDRMALLDSTAEFERLLKAPADALSSVTTELDGIDDTNPMDALDRCARLAGQISTGLRRIATLRAPERTDDESLVKPRIDLVNSWMKESGPTFEKLVSDYALQVSTFAAGISRAESPGGFGLAESDGARTNLYDNLNELVRQDSPKARQFSLLVTDGVDSGGQDAGEFSADVRNQPLIVLPIGDSLTSPDARIESVVSPARIREKDIFVAAVEVSTANSGPGKLTVTLKEKEEILASREVMLEGDGGSAIVELEWQAIGIGPRDLKIELSQIAGEDYVINNSRGIDCTVTKDRYRVLVCDAFPRWETRYLQNLFKRDESIEMISLVFEPRHTYPGNKPQEALALPLSEEAWQEFDLVILGDVTPLQLTPDHQDVLVDYVDKGGNLILMAGPNAMPAAFVGTPLESLLPMTRTGEKSIDGTFVIGPPENQPVSRMVQLDGGNTRSIWRTIFTATPQHRIEPWTKAKESAMTLLTATDLTTGEVRDFCAAQRFGRGRVAYFAAPCLYHLRFRFGDRYHARVWGQLIRGMCVDNFGFGDSLVSTRLDRLRWEPGEEVQGRVRVTTADGGPFEHADFTAVLTSEGVVAAEMKPVPDPDRPGDYFFRFPKLPPGEYEVDYTGEQLRPLLEHDRAQNPESRPAGFTVTGARLSEEAQFASETPGFWNRVNSLPLAATIAPGTLPFMLEALDFQPETVSLTTKRSIWDTWWLLLAIIMISGTEWCLRRLSGLC